MNSSTQTVPDHCPLCGNAAGIESARLLRYRCRVCGGPRVPVFAPGFRRSGAERGALGQAQRARVRRAIWQVIAGIVGAFGLLSLAVALLVLVVATPNLTGSVVLLGVICVPLLMSFLGLRKARQARRDLETDLDQAWQLVATEVLEKTPEPLPAARLGVLMGISESKAERLLAVLNATDLVESHVTDAGEVVYLRRGAPVARLRLEAGAGSDQYQEEPETLEAEERPGRTR